MESFLGIPTALLAAVLAGLTAAAIIVIALLAVRRPVLVKLGIRQIPRRRGRSVLIIIGLALSTTIVAASFGTGDAMGHTVRSLVAGSLGGVDEIVVFYPEGARRFGMADLQGVAEGRIPILAGADFPEREAARIADLLRDEQGVAGVVGSVVRQYHVSDLTQQTASGALNVLALPSDTPASFGALVDTDGAAVTMGELDAGEVYLNAAGASLLAAASGDELAIYRRDEQIPARLRAVVTDGELGGTQPTLYARLDWWQTVDRAPGRINQVLIRNHGGSDSLRWSAPITRTLRASLVDDTAAHQLHRLLGEPPSLEALRASIDEQPALVRPRLARLVSELERSEATDDFKALIGDPRLLSALRPGLLRLPPGTARDVAEALRTLNGLTVIELKQLSIDIADQFASAFTSAFLVLGVFSIATGVMLVFLIFALLAADRRPELGMARALGTHRGQIVQLFLFEGGLYDLAASLVGVLAGLAVARLTLELVGDYLATYSIRVTNQVESRSLLIAFCLGLLLTFGTVVIAAWRIARLDVVTAIRNLPEQPTPPRSVRELAARGSVLRLTGMLLARGPGLIGIGVALVFAADGRRALLLVTGVGWSLAMVGIGLSLRWALQVAGVRRATSDRIGVTVAGLSLALFWAQPLSGTLRWRSIGLAASLEYLAVGGLLTVLGVVWVVTYNLELLPSVVAAAGRALRRAAPLTAAVRLAAAYPARYRWRTGLAILMFALVIFTVTTASVLLAGTRYAYTDLGVQTAGFDLRAEADPARIPDLGARLATAEAVGPETFDALGGQSQLEAEAVQLGAPSARWQPLPVQVVDAGWLSGVGAPLTHRARGYGSDAEVWDALAERPGLAVLHGSAVPNPAARAQRADPLGAAPFLLQGTTRDDEALSETSLWLRQPDGPPLRVTVIGVLDSRTALGEGVYTTPVTLSAAGWRPPPSDTYYFSVAAGQTPRSAALGLSRSFGAEGLAVTVLDEQVRAAQGIRLVLNEILTGFMALGLVSGVVALGIIATRAVVERRQQIGVLRAIGFRRGLVHGVFLLESTLVAWLGIAVGTTMGILLARNVVAFIAADNPEIEFAIPWGQIGLIALIAYGCTLLTTMLPAWRAGRIYPADALRYE